MIAALSVLRESLVGLYDESFLLLRANLLALLLNLPVLGLAALALTPWWPAGTAGEPFGATFGLFVLTLLLLLPTPGQLGISGLASVISANEAPPLGLFWQTLRRFWRQGLALTSIGWVVLGLLAGNAIFYFTVVDAPWNLLSILWAYATLLWLGMQVYLLPLLLYVQEPRRPGLYRRAASLALAQPFFTLSMLLFTVLVAVVGAALLPLYLLTAGALVSLFQSFSLRSLRRRYGGDEGPSDASEERRWPV